MIAMTDLRSVPVAVVGAYGHTGRFVVAELLRRGLVPILSGRDPRRLAALTGSLPGPDRAVADNAGLDTRAVAMDDAGSLDRALAGAVAVINCAGPFVATSGPVIEAAVRAGIPYLDVTAEVEMVADTVAGYADRARQAGIPVVPAMAFWGGLGDLLATAAMGDWPAADRISTAYALSSWRPTAGTRSTGRVSAGRRAGRRIRYLDGGLRTCDGAAPLTTWKFPEPVGAQAVVGEFTMADSATIPTHLTVRDIITYMSVTALEDLRSADPAGPVAADESGRSTQTFLVEAVAERDGRTRRATAAGRDIYAVTAPLVVEATCRILAGPHRPSGVVTAGALMDAREFLLALHPQHLTVGFG